MNKKSKAPAQSNTLFSFLNKAKDSNGIAQLSNLNDNRIPFRCSKTLTDTGIGQSDDDTDKCSPISPIYIENLCPDELIAKPDQKLKSSLDKMTQATTKASHNISTKLHPFFTLKTKEAEILAVPVENHIVICDHHDYRHDDLTLNDLHDLNGNGTDEALGLQCKSQPRTRGRHKSISKLKPNKVDTEKLEEAHDSAIMHKSFGLSKGNEHDVLRVTSPDCNVFVIDSRPDEGSQHELISPLICGPSARDMNPAVVDDSTTIQPFPLWGGRQLRPRVQKIVSAPESDEDRDTVLLVTSRRRAASRGVSGTKCRQSIKKSGRSSVDIASDDSLEENCDVNYSLEEDDVIEVERKGLTKQRRRRPRSSSGSEDDAGAHSIRRDRKSNVRNRSAAKDFFLDKVARERQRVEEQERRFQEELMRSRELSAALFRGKSVNPFFLGHASSGTTSGRTVGRDEGSCPVSSTAFAEVVSFPPWQHVTQRLDDDRPHSCDSSYTTTGCSVWYRHPPSQMPACTTCTEADSSHGSAEPCLAPHLRAKERPWSRFADLSVDPENVDGVVLDLRSAWLYWAATFIAEERPAALYDKATRNHSRVIPNSQPNVPAKVGLAEEPSSRLAAVTSLQDWLRAWTGNSPAALPLVVSEAPLQPRPQSTSSRGVGPLADKRVRRRLVDDDGWLIDDEDDDIRSFKDEDDDDDHQDELPNVFVLRGPTGSGKSELVHTSAASLGMRVIEIGTDQCRGGANLKRLAAEATRSRSITLTAAIGGPSAAGTDLGVGGSVAAGEGLSLLFFDEADTVFADDAGFHAAVTNLARNSRRPMLLTTELPLPFTRVLKPAPVECVLERADHQETIAKILASTGMTTLPPSVVETLAVVSQCDCRASLASLACLPGRPGRLQTEMRVESRDVSELETTSLAVLSANTFTRFLAREGVDFALLDRLDSILCQRALPGRRPPAIAAPTVGHSAIVRPCSGTGQGGTSYRGLRAPDVYSANGKPCSAGWEVTVTGKHFLQRSLRRGPSADHTDPSSGQTDSTVADIAAVELVLMGHSVLGGPHVITGTVVSDGLLQAVLLRSSLQSTNDTPSTSSKAEQDAEGFSFDLWTVGKQPPVSGLLIAVQIDGLLCSDTTRVSNGTAYLELHRKLSSRLVRPKGTPKRAVAKVARDGSTNIGLVTAVGDSKLAHRGGRLLKNKRKFLADNDVCTEAAESALVAGSDDSDDFQDSDDQLPSRRVRSDILKYSTKTRSTGDTGGGRQRVINDEDGPPVGLAREQSVNTCRSASPDDFETSVRRYSDGSDTLADPAHGNTAHESVQHMPVEFSTEQLDAEVGMHSDISNVSEPPSDVAPQPLEVDGTAPLADLAVGSSLCDDSSVDGFTDVRHVDAGSGGVPDLLAQLRIKEANQVTDPGPPSACCSTLELPMRLELMPSQVEDLPHSLREVEDMSLLLEALSASELLTACTVRRFIEDDEGARDDDDDEDEDGGVGLGSVPRTGEPLDWVSASTLFQEAAELRRSAACVFTGCPSDYLHDSGLAGSRQMATSLVGDPTTNDHPPSSPPRLPVQEGICELTSSPSRLSPTKRESTDAAADAELGESQVFRVSRSQLARPATTRLAPIDLTASVPLAASLGGFLLHRLRRGHWCRAARRLLLRNCNDVTGGRTALSLAVRLDIFPLLAILARVADVVNCEVADWRARSAQLEPAGQSLGRGCRRRPKSSSSAADDMLLSISKIYNMADADVMLARRLGSIVDVEATTY